MPIRKTVVKEAWVDTDLGSFDSIIGAANPGATCHLLLGLDADRIGGSLDQVIDSLREFQTMVGTPQWTARFRDFQRKAGVDPVVDWLQTHQKMIGIVELPDWWLDVRKSITVDQLADWLRDVRKKIKIDPFVAWLHGFQKSVMVDRLVKWLTDFQNMVGTTDPHVFAATVFVLDWSESDKARLSDEDLDRLVEAGACFREKSEEFSTPTVDLATALRQDLIAAQVISPQEEETLSEAPPPPPSPEVEALLQYYGDPEFVWPKAAIGQLFGDDSADATDRLPR